MSDVRLSWFYSVQCWDSTSDKGMVAVFLVLSNLLFAGWTTIRRLWFEMLAASLKKH